MPSVLPEAQRWCLRSLFFFFSDCSIVSLTSGPISRAHVAKKTAGLVWAVEIIVCLPCEAQTSAEVFQKALTEYRPATDWPAVEVAGLTRNPRGKLPRWAKPNTRLRAPRSPGGSGR